MSNKKKHTEKELTEKQTYKLMLGAAFSSHVLIICIYNKQKANWYHQHVSVSKEYVKIMQTLQDK